MIILVPEINILNFPLYFVLSFMFQVKAYKIQSFLYKYCRRIKIIELSNYFDWEDCQIIKSEAVKIWEDILIKFPNHQWKVRVKNLTLDFSLKAKQDLQKEIEKILFMKQIIQYNKDKKNKIFIINSLNFYFLSKVDPENDLFCYPQIRLLSAMNIFLDRLNFIIVNVFLINKVISKFIYGIIYNRRIKGKIKYIYNGISPRELSIDKDMITFTWLIDNESICKKDILFLLPKADFQMIAYAFDYKKDKDLLATHHFAMIQFATYKKIFFAFFEVIKVMIRRIIFIRFKVNDLMLTKYLIRILEWFPVIESLKPKVYINTSSNLGAEDPGIIYFNNIGIKTVNWLYGTNSYLFLTQNKNCGFRDVIFCNIISSILVVWNSHFKDFIFEHPQNRLKIEVIGPLMSADEKVCGYNKQFLFKKFKLSFNEEVKYVTIFDSPPVAKNYRGISAWCPDCNSEEYNFLFLKDMYKLLFDFRDIVLIYKPKRSLTSGKFSYSTETRQILNDMNNNPRVIILDYNINPWIPIAIADICISMPFESPTIAALHYEKPALFHDPLNIALYHRYQNFSELITHNYKELKDRVNKYLYDENVVDNIFKESKIRILQGYIPRYNSSNKFREYLNLLANNKN